MFADFAYAIRQLRKAPGFAVVAVFSIALGLAANTAIFSFVADVLWRPLPLSEPEKLAILWEKLPNGDVARPSLQTFEQWAGQVPSLEKLGALRPMGWALTSGDGPAERARGGLVTPEFCDVFRYRPALGRLFEAEDFRAGHEDVAVISHRFWVRRFNADPAVLGTAITLNQVPYTIIGVLAPNGSFSPAGQEVIAPLAAGAVPANQRGTRNYFVIARLKRAGAHATAQAEMDLVANRLAATFPDTHRGHGASVRPIDNWIGFQSEDRKSVLIMFAAVACVQLIVCANLAALLLARAVARRKEIAVRAALGASAARLARQFLAEALLLAAAGGATGLLLAFWLMKLLTPLMPGLPMGLAVHVSLDWRVVGFAALATLLTGGLFGLLPAWQAARVDLNKVLKDGTRSGSDSRSGRRLGSVLVAGEIAVAVALVVAAGLIGQTLWGLARVPLGFVADNAGYLTVTLPAKKFPTDESVVNFVRDVERRAAALPGVLHAAAGTRVPTMGFPDDTFVIAGGPVPPPSERPRTTTQSVGADYFATLGIPLFRGRAFTEQDGLGSPRVAIVNRAFVEKFFPGRDPLGQQLVIDLALTGRVPSDSPAPWQIVGVAGNVRVRGVPGVEEPMVTVPLAQHPALECSIALRAQGNPAGALRALRESINELDRDVLADRIGTLSDILATNLGAERNRSWLLGGFAAVALVLAALGTYGVIAYGVSQRTREIGIRMALGAQRHDVLSLILRQGFRLTVAGVTMGLAASFAVGKAMESLLYGVQAFDLATWGVAALGLSLIALIACWLPARRALRVDPIVALRAE